MPLIINGTEIEHVIFKAPGINQELDEIYANATKVFVSTIFVAKPTVSGSFTFDNSEKSPTITGYDASAMTQSGTTSATAAGTYTVTYTPKAGYAWTDGTTSAVSLTWSIAKRSITIPSISNTTKTYNGGSQAPTISNVNSTYVTQSGTATATSAGSYTVTWALKYPASTTWTDGTTSNKTGSWSIGKLAVTIPSISNTTTFPYVQGATHSVTVANMNATYVNQSGSASATDGANPTTYTITWSLKDTSNTQWKDGTTTNKAATWGTVWVNGTSHYANDLYNKGWYSSGSLEFQYAVTWNSDSFTIGSPGGGTSFATAASYAGKTFHAIVTCTGTVTLVECPEGSWNRRTITSVSAPSAAEISGAHSTDWPRFGLATGAVAFTVQRVWIT